MIPFEDWRSEIVTKPPEMMDKDKPLIHWTCEDCLHFPCIKSDDEAGEVCGNFELW